jgi:transposase-like protein
MLQSAMHEKSKPRCPNCHSEAFYRYGKVRGGKQRYICLLCTRQFVVGAAERAASDKPRCPECGSSMHVYKRETRMIRYRCSNYPGCRTFTKIIFKEMRI